MITLLLMERTCKKLTEDDIIDSIKVLVSLAKIMFGWQNGDSTNGNA
nr:MAG TPA: hypothetical protein [Bacteriophage sp.]